MLYLVQDGRESLVNFEFPWLAPLVFRLDEHGYHCSLCFGFFVCLACYVLYFRVSYLVEAFAVFP